jgi:hypothetical protein
MRQVVRHHNNQHDKCPRDYPESQIRFIAMRSKDAIEHWKAEWHHAHGDHDLCKPQYMFGCTTEEKLQYDQLERHQQGEHSHCPPDFPNYLLKPDVSQGSQPIAVIQELDVATKRAWEAQWKHEHGEHALCRARYGYGCDRGQPVTDEQIAKRKKKHKRKHKDKRRARNRS